MDGTSQQSLEQFPSISSAGDSCVELHMLTEQPLPPKDERIISINPSPDASISGFSRNVKDQRSTSETSVAVTNMYPFNAYTPQEQGFHYGGYGNDTGNQDEQSNYVNSNNLHVIPMAMYNDNASVYFPPGYGFDSQIAYGQFSPLANPLSPIMVDNHLFSPHQMPMSPSYYPPPVSPRLPHVTSALPVAQSELVPSASRAQENLNENAAFGPGSGYYLPFGSFGGDISGSSGVGLYNISSEFGSGEPFPNHSSAIETSRFMSPLTSGTVYPHPIGILGAYKQNVAQTPIQGFGLMSNSSARHYPHVGSYQSTGGSTSNWSRFPTDKGRRHEGDRDSASISTDLLGFSTDRNRGPRASKKRGKSSPEMGSSSRINKDVNSSSGFHVDQFNPPDFITDYENAKFFVIKSFSEDNVHKSIKYGIWASTPLGNRKLDAAYHEGKEMKGTCPVFLFFSVNASGQFCGVAEMVGPVDFENDADYWQQDRWIGQFPVKWHIIKDVPNTQFRHIHIENNENKPVTHSRDSQEVKLEQGLEFLQIFKNHDADTSLLDDFNFYDEREKSLLERKDKQRASSTGNTTSLAAESINQLSNNLANALGLEGGKNIPHPELE